MKRRLSFEDALAKAQRYCAYQDRCHQEMRSKLLEWGVYGDDLELVLAELVQERFLDEERFARSFSRGKFRIKQWGRLRIVRELKRREISEYCIRAGLSEIEEQAYLQTIQDVIDRKNASLPADIPAFERNQKLFRYALSRGFEPELILAALKDM